MNNQKSVYQECPVCKGTGKDKIIKINETGSLCSVCNGKKIISIFNGKPPK